MRKIVTSALAPLVLIFVVALSSPAGATKIGQAQQICSANPNCTGIKNKDGSWGACVSGVEKCVFCPKQGNCTAGKTAGGGGGRGGSVIGTLSGSKLPPGTTSPGNPKGKTPRDLGRTTPTRLRQTGGSNGQSGSTFGNQRDGGGGGDKRH